MEWLKEVDWVLDSPFFFLNTSQDVAAFKTGVLSIHPSQIHLSPHKAYLPGLQL